MRKLALSVKDTNKKQANVFSHSRNFMIAELFNKGVSFLTIPIFTRLLSPSEYGVLAIVTSIVSIFTVIMGLNIAGAVNRKYLEFHKDFDQFMGTNLAFYSFSNILFLFLGFLFKDFLGAFFAVSGSVFFTGMLISCFSIYIQIDLAYLHASQQSKRYAFYSVIRNLGITSIAIIWVMNFEENRYLGKVYAELLVSIIIAFYSVWQILKISKFSIKKKHILYALSFGLPLVPHALSGFVLAQFDRIILNQISGSHDTGIYSFAYNIGMIMAVAVTAIGNAQGPISMALFKKKRFDLIQNLVNNTSKVIFFIALVLILFAKEIISLVASPEYQVALSIVPIIVLSSVMTYLYGLFIFYPYYYKKTWAISIFTFIAGFANIGLNYLFIPKFGYIAAAWTTLASYILLFVLHYCNTVFIMKKNTLRIRKILFQLLILIIIIWGYSLVPFDSVVIFHIGLKISIIFYYIYYIDLKESIRELRK